MPREDLGGYSMDRSMRLRIGHFLDGPSGAVHRLIGPRVASSCGA